LLKYRIILAVTLFIELGMLTFFRGIAGPYVSPLILLTASLLIGIYPLCIYHDLSTPLIPKKKQLPLWYRLSLVLPLVIILTVITISILTPLIRLNPIDTDTSKIIPTIQIMVQRFLNFEFPYKIITEWGGLQPSFLPFQWMPFLLGELFNMDYRWVAFIFWMTGTVLYEYRLLRAHIGLLLLIFLSILPFAVLIIFVHYVPESITRNIELLLTGFYMILSLSLLSNSMYFRVIGIVATLLSRFANLLWIPLYLAVTYFAEKKQRAIVLAGSMLCAVVIFYALPFLSQNLLIFQQGQKYRTKAAIADWKIKDTSGYSTKPMHLFKGVGVACFFYEFKAGDMTKKVKALQKMHLILSILSILILAIIFMVHQDTIDYKLFNLLSLKIHLAIFFNFFQVPHVYLFLVPVFVSVIIVAEIFTMEKKLKRI
jgi:hypothetical protein